MKFYGGVLGSTMKNSLNFGGDLVVQVMIQNFFFFFFFLGGGGGGLVFHHQGSTFLQWAIWE